MEYKDIKEFNERCEEHPDHQSGMITNSMIQQRLHEEIDELREYIEQHTWVGLTDDDLRQIILVAIGVAEAKLKDKNSA